MKKNVLILCLTALSVCGAAQTKSVDIDSKSFTYAYRAFPVAIMNPPRFTYATKITLTNIGKKSLSPDDLDEFLFIVGQEKTDDPSKALLLLELNFGNIIVTGNSFSERTEEKKDKAGKVTVHRYFRAVITYTFISSYTIARGGQILKTGSLHTRENEIVHETKEYNSRREAYDYWENNREVLIDEFYRLQTGAATVALSELASQEYGFTESTGNWDVVKTTDEKKHVENEVFRAAVNSLVAVLEAMTPDIPMNREMANSLIKYFESIPQKYADPKSKADMHLRYAAYFNLCKIYYYLDEPENVDKYADLLTMNGYDAKDGGKLKKAAIELRLAFDKIGIRTRHFVPDVVFGKGGK
jgi:hypothetical protein